MTLRGKSLRDGVDDRVALLVLVDELALVGRTDVQLAAVADDAILFVVLVALRELADSDLLEFDLHSRLFAIENAGVELDEVFVVHLVVGLAARSGLTFRCWTVVELGHDAFAAVASTWV